MEKFEELKRRMIVALYEWSLTPKSKVEFDAELASSLIGVGIGMGQQIIHVLNNDEIIVRVGNHFPTRYEITLSLIEKAEAILEFDPPESETAPASDRIVTLDHNKPEYKDAIAAVEKAISAARDSNEFGQLFADPREKVVALSEMESGLQLLKQRASDAINAVHIRVETIKRMLLDKFKSIIERIPESLAADAAKEAAKKLWELIKSALGGGV